MQKVMQRAQRVGAEVKTSKTIRVYSTFVAEHMFLPFPAGVQVNTGAAKRFIRNALWEADKEGPSGSAGGAETPSSSVGRTGDKDSGSGSARKKRKLDTK